MYEFKTQHTFITKTEEQAEYIKKFFADAESLMTCETSWTVATDVLPHFKMVPCPSCKATAKQDSNNWTIYCDKCEFMGLPPEGLIGQDTK